MSPGDNWVITLMCVMQERERVAQSKKRMHDRNAQLKAHEDHLAELRGEKLKQIAMVEERERKAKQQARLDVRVVVYCEL